LEQSRDLEIDDSAVSHSLSNESKASKTHRKRTNAKKPNSDLEESLFVTFDQEQKLNNLERKYFQTQKTYQVLQANCEEQDLSTYRISPSQERSQTNFNVQNMLKSTS